MTNVFKPLSILGFGILFSFSSCDKVSVETSRGTDEIELTISNLNPGSFEISWDDVYDASWYFIEITRDGELASNFYDGNTGHQETEVSISYRDTDLIPGESYQIKVKASSSLIRGETVGEGTLTVSIPDLPAEVLGSWQAESRGNWIFNADATFVAPDYNSSENKTWTISEGNIVIITDWLTNLQFETYNYTISIDGKTLTLDNTLTSMSYTLTK